VDESANNFWGELKESRKTIHPLFKRLLAMTQHQGIHAPLSDQPGGNHRFPKSRAGR
jgi:hypothetical protein